MAERPDYEKGIALLSAPAEGLLWIDLDSFGPMGLGAGGPTSETVHCYAPAGQIAEVVGFEFYVDEPDTWLAGDAHSWELAVASGTFTVFADEHAHGSVPADMGWAMSMAMADYLAGSSVGFPIPDTHDRQWARLHLLTCTATESLRFRYVVPGGATVEQYCPRYYDLLLRVKAVS